MPRHRIKHHPIVGTVAGRLREARRGASLTQQELASKSKISVSYVARLERGEAAVGIDVLAELASALGISPAVLIDTQPDHGESLGKLQETLKQKAQKLSKRGDAAALRAATLVLHLIDNAISHGA